jgi:hypothetical protein
MISDVLSEAARDIRSYLRDIPQAYSDAAFQVKVHALLAQMDSLRRELDALPGFGPQK